MSRKSFFQERTAAEIRKLDVREAYHQRGLVKKIDSLDEGKGLIVRAQIIPGKFFINAENATEAAKKCYKHGDFLGLCQARTQADAYQDKRIPLALRDKAFSALSSIQEESLNLIGYSFWPVQGRDRRERRVPFVWLPEAERLFAYAENMAGGIKVKAYDDAKRVVSEGAKVLCSVPSRTRKKPRYNLRLESVPMDGATERRAVVWGLKSNFEISPEHRELATIKYNWEGERRDSDVFIFYPQDIAAYIAVVGDAWKNHNLTPMEMNPFALPSRHQAEFYQKLCNNVLVYDPTLQRKEKLRKMYIAEKSILLGRAISVFGHNDFAFWDPVRDGKLKDYDWSMK